MKRKTRNYYQFKLNTISIENIKNFLNKDITKSKVNGRVMSLFLKQLSLLIGSGIALDKSLKIIENQKLDKKLNITLHKINSDLSKGKSVNDAFKANSDSFDSLILAFIRSGEESGKMAEVLDELSEYINEDSKNKAIIKQALIYPLILLIITIAIVIVMLAFVLPTFEEVFLASERSLPLSTRTLLAISKFFNENGLIILIFILIVIISLNILRRDKDIRLKFDYFNFTYLPMKKFRKLKLEYQFTSLLYILLAGDIKIIPSLRIIKDAFNNFYIKEVIENLINDLEKGQSLSICLSENDIFTPLFKSMIKIGEDSGQMVSAIKKSSEYYANDYIFKLKRLESLLEPLMIILMSIIVGFVVFAVAIPIFDSVNAIGY